MYGKLFRVLILTKQTANTLYLKLCSNTICIPLKVISNQALISDSFPCDSKNLSLLTRKATKKVKKLLPKLLAPYLCLNL